jgi:putative membrane protein
MNNWSNKTSNELAEDRTDFALKRTVMAADRTLMAWVRTALSMISFGFTIYKLLQSFHESPDISIGERIDPSSAGLFLVGLGTISMALGTFEYWQTIREFRRIEPIKVWRPTMVMAAIISVVGVSTFLSIVLKAI